MRVISSTFVAQPPWLWLPGSQPGRLCHMKSPSPLPSPGVPGEGDNFSAGRGRATSIHAQLQRVDAFDIRLDSRKETDMNEVIGQLGQLKIIPVIALEDADDAMALGEALVEGGLPVAEVTFRTEAASQSIRTIAPPGSAGWCRHRAECRHGQAGS